MSTEPLSQDNDSQNRERTRIDQETENRQIDRDFRGFMIPLAGGAIFAGLGLGFLINPSGGWHVDLTKLRWIAASIAIKQSGHPGIPFFVLLSYFHVDGVFIITGISRPVFGVVV